MQEVSRSDETDTDDQTHRDKDQHSSSEVGPLRNEGAANEMGSHSDRLTRE
jgi:hypothetical protein